MSMKKEQLKIAFNNLISAAAATKLNFEENEVLRNSIAIIKKVVEEYEEKDVPNKIEHKEEDSK